MIGTSLILARCISYLRVSLKGLATWVMCANPTGWCVTPSTGRGYHRLDTNPIFLIQSANTQATAENRFWCAYGDGWKMH